MLLSFLIECYQQLTIVYINIIKKIYKSFWLTTDDEHKSSVYILSELEGFISTRFWISQVYVLICSISSKIDDGSLKVFVWFNSIYSSIIQKS